MGEGDYNLDFFDRLDFDLEDNCNPNKTVMISEAEYTYLRNQVKMYSAVSDKLFKTFYGPDYYFSDPLSPVQVYYETVTDVIKYIKFKKQNIFKRLWQKITKW